MMIGLGIDLIDLQHFSVHYGSEDPELLGRCFTAREIADVGQDSDRLARLAGRFAVKEATFKALGGDPDIAHLHIETITCEDGAPQVQLQGRAQELAESRGVTALFVSISHSASSAAAVVIAWGGPR